MRKLREKDFMQLFQLRGYVPFFISSRWSEVYIPLRALAIYSDKLWRSYMPKTSYKKTGEEGLKLYSSRKNYKKFQVEIKESFQETSSVCNSAFEKPRLNSQEIRKCLDCAYRFLDLYRKTEFFYIDLPFKRRETSLELRKNLNSFEKFKFKAREYLNQIFFGSRAYVNKLSEHASQDLGIPLQDIQTYSTDEILSAYDQNFRLSPLAVADRKEAFFSYVDDGAAAHSFGKAAKKSALDFYGPQRKVTELYGQTANRGRTQGRARVFNFALEKFDEVYKLVDAMQEGEILIAETTAPEIVLACKKAAGIVTNQGGMMSHAAIVSRELGIPCVVGTHKATLEIKTGDLVEVDANSGVIRIIEKG